MDRPGGAASRFRSASARWRAGYAAPRAASAPWARTPRRASRPHPWAYARKRGLLVRIKHRDFELWVRNCIALDHPVALPLTSQLHSYRPPFASDLTCTRRRATGRERPIAVNEYSQKQRATHGIQWRRRRRSAASWVRLRITLRSCCFNTASPIRSAARISSAAASSFRPAMLSMVLRVLPFKAWHLSKGRKN